MTSSDLSSLSSVFREKKGVAKWGSRDHATENASCFEVSPDGKSVAVGHTEGDLTIFALTDKGNFEVSDRKKRHEKKITNVAFNPTATLLASCSNEPNVSVTSFRKETSAIGSRGMQLKLGGPVRAVTFMEDFASHSNILISAVGRRICITDCPSGATFKDFAGHTGAVNSLCTWGGCMFASSSSDNTVRIWDMRVKEAVKVYEPLSKPAAVASTSFHVDSGGRVLLRGDGVGAVHAYDISTGKKIVAKQLLSTSSTCLRLSRSKRFLVAADQSSWHPSLPNFITLDNQLGLRAWNLEQEEVPVAKEKLAT